jgi:hypothetical protein
LTINLNYNLNELNQNISVSPFNHSINLINNKTQIKLTDFNLQADEEQEIQVKIPIFNRTVKHIKDTKKIVYAFFHYILWFAIALLVLVLISYVYINEKESTEEDNFEEDIKIIKKLNELERSLNISK